MDRTMKKFLLKLSILVAFSSISMSALAQGKVAYVDIDRVSEHARSVNKTFVDIEQKMKAFQEEIDSKTKLLQTLRSDIKKGEGVLAESALKSKKDEASKLEAELTELQFKGKREFQKIDATVFEPTIKEMILTIKEVAEEKKIDLVLRGEVVIYASDNVDITEAVIAKMNANAGSTSKITTNTEKSASSTSESISTQKKESVIQKSILPSLDKPASSNDGSSTGPKRPVDRQKD